MQESAFSEPPVEEDAAARQPPAAGDHRARAGRYYRNVRYVVFAAALGMGAYFLYDGFIGYPRERDRYHELNSQLAAASARQDSAEVARVNQQLADEGVKDHNDAAILLQKVLGFTLPPLALLLLARWLYISRGEVRLDGTDTLHVPGHPPIPESAIRSIDDALWERKGIAYVEYEQPDGAGGAGGETRRAKLDDFVYDRPPIDAIHDRLVHLLGSRSGAGRGDSD